jgi:hypothetical protein
MPNVRPLLPNSLTLAPTQMATLKPDFNSTELQRTTLAFGTVSLDSEKQTTDQNALQLDSDCEETAEETDAQQDQGQGNIDKAKKDASPNSTPGVPLPFTLFVYGPLADRFFLTYTIKMGQNPELTRSSISGYRMKFSNGYPVPIPAHGKTISEFSVPVRNETQLRKITKWYAAAYKLVDCRIEIMRNKGQDYAASTKNWVPPRWVRDRVVDGKVFVWAGDVESEELREGYWDEGWWEMERDAIMGIKKKTNTRELYDWEVKQRSKLDVWEDERDEERQKLRRAEEAKTRKLNPRIDEERREGELAGLD